MKYSILKKNMGYGTKRKADWKPSAKHFVRLFDDTYKTPDGFYNTTKLASHVRSAGKTARQLFRGSKSTPKRGATISSTPTPRSQTMATTRMRRGKGAYNSNSKGFLKTVRKSRKPKGYQAGKGITATYETGNVLGNQDIVYIGHITGPTNQILLIAMQSMVKLLLTKMNIRINNLFDLMSSVKFAVGDIFRVTYHINSTTSATTNFQVIIAVPTSFAGLSLDLKNLLQGITSIDWVPRSFEYIPIGSQLQAASISLEALMFHYDIKSTLKIQNRSINTAGNDEADEVDNVPLYGKSIGGKGTGVVARYPNSTSPANVVGDITSGLISNVSLDDNAKEPLSGYFFPKSSQQGKVHLDPGALKTSVLTTKRSIGLKYLLRMNYQISGTQSITPFGSYRFFQLEKMIDTGVVINLLVAYEHNLAISCFATTKYNYTTAPIYAKV